MNERIRLKKYNATLVVGFFAYVIYLITYLWIFDMSDVPEFVVWFFSVVGIAEFAYILCSYKKRSGVLFNLYTIAIILMFIFNFGQCFAWAFGIHIEGEIGSEVLLRHTRPTSIDILKAQIVFMISVMLFHVASVCDDCRMVDVSLADNRNNKINNESNVVFVASAILSCAVIPATLYNSYSNLIQAWEYGYGSLYYGDLASNTNVIIAVLQYSFFPCLIGLLIGSNYKKSVSVFVYSIFLFYLAINLLSGDRGSWFYPLLILIWMRHRFYKKIRVKKFFLYAIIAFLSLYVVSAIVSVRNIGITFENVVNALTTAKNNAFLESIFEMGGSMGVNIIVIKDGVNYPIGNSYFLALIGSITTQIPKFFNVQYVTLTRWFSQEYLGIGWGAAFTIVAEAVVNFGVLLAPLLFVFLGRIFKKPLNAGYRTHLLPNKVVIHISISFFFMSMIRNTMHDFMRGMFFGILPLMFVIFLVKVLKKASTAINEESHMEILE